MSQSGPPLLPGIDRRIGLQIIRDGIPGVIEQFVAAFAADHAESKSVIELERRADGESKLSDAHLIAVAEMDDRQIRRIDLDHSDIRLLVASDDLRLKLAAVLELHVDPVRAVEDVIVCKNVAVRPNDESRAFALQRSEFRADAPRGLFSSG